MKNLSYTKCEDLANYIIDLVSDDKYVIVYTVVKYEKARQLLKELAIFDTTTFEFIDLSDAEYDGYDSEYYVIVDSNFRVSVEKAWHETNAYHPAGYYRFEATHLIIDDDDTDDDLSIVDCILNENCKVNFVNLYIDDDNIEDDDTDEDDAEDETDDDECGVNLTKGDVDTVKDLIHSLLDFAFDNI